MKESALKGFVDKLGPGLIFAAVAVGVSHLVQSTRAGAEYGLSLSALIVFACLIKYPAFRFGTDYAAATGLPLMEAYRRQGRWALAIYIFNLPLDMFVATAAIALVTTGIFKNVFPIEISDVLLSFILLVCSAVLLASGRYRFFETITKVIVVLFSILTVIAAMLSIPEINWGEDDMTRTVELDRTTLLFMIAIAGWMPTGVSVSMFQSLWVCEKARIHKRKITGDEARFDFNLGYVSSIVLALCFVLMGAALMYRSGVTPDASAAGFAGQLIDMFTQVIGAWSRPLIAVAALAVMVSTLLSGLDAGPRAASFALGYLLPSVRENSRRSYLIILVFQVFGAALMLFFFLRSFKTFIDFATSIAFLFAPLLAWLNHRAVFSGELEAAEQPGRIMRLWSQAGIVIMGLIAVYYMYSRLG